MTRPATQPRTSSLLSSPRSALLLLGGAWGSSLLQIRVARRPSEPGRQAKTSCQQPLALAFAQPLRQAYLPWCVSETWLLPASGAEGAVSVQGERGQRLWTTSQDTEAVPPACVRNQSSTAKPTSDQASLHAAPQRAVAQVCQR